MTADLEYEVEASPVTKVARDLSEILDLYARLHAQAVNHARAKVDGTSMPGGRAMVELGCVANLEAWENMQQASERYGNHPVERLRRCYTSAEDEDPDEAWSAFSLLEFWSEAWRTEHGMLFEATPHRPRPTVASEANFIRWALNWAWDHEPHWDDFAADVKAARLRLENVLHAGERSERGAPCLYDECRGSRLVRKLEPKRGKDGEKVWRFSDWHCPKCHRSWDEDRYAANVAAAHERTKVEVINGETWCTVEYASRMVERPESTIRGWVFDRDVATACIIAGHRHRFVRMADVERKHDESKRKRTSAA